MIRRFVVLSTAALLGAVPAARAQHAGASPSRSSFTPPREASQFDFLIGQWELAVTPKVSSLAAKIHGAPKLLGTWKAWRALDGFGILDELRIVDGSGNPSSLSSTLRIYDATSHKWLSSFADAYRGVVSTAGAEWKNGEMIASGQGVDAEGKPYITRTRFYDITATGFKYRQDRSTDNGRTWDEGVLSMVAKRTAAEAAR